MWLLDVNLPNGLLRFLRDRDIDCDSTVRRGWRELTNGELTSAAFASGFYVILTRDRDFGVAASSALGRWPEIAVVVVTIPQAREHAYLEAFGAQWQEQRITPIPGSVIEWP
jgi:predicted nuclease of predicted toxin-antitoxin system